MNVEHAIITKQTWRSPVMDAYARALITSGRTLLLFKRVPYFNNDDVPAAFQPNDGTTVGATFKQLQLAGIIEPWRGSVPELQIWGGMRKSTRPENNGHRNQLWALTSIAAADTWLSRHGATQPDQQMRLF